MTFFKYNIELIISWLVLPIFPVQTLYVCVFDENDGTVLALEGGFSMCVWGLACDLVSWVSYLFLYTFFFFSPLIFLIWVLLGFKAFWLRELPEIQN